MTPTLFGRWQTRIFLLSTVGILLTLPFAWGWVGDRASLTYFWVLLYLGLVGLAWDCLYHLLQQFLWDHDWPGILQLGAAVIEAIFLIMLINFFDLPHISPSDLNLSLFVLHYSVVWVAVYLSSWVIMRLFFPRWRFRGGRLLGNWHSII
ncbi:MAG: hypothetical protein QNJ65_20800 [Xenococcaceae cyanobacterium MO_234.B1]|nr:hypothetical protein [Xenococcaceae cyanobacterium MO_234.B1]